MKDELLSGAGKGSIRKTISGKIGKARMIKSKKGSFGGSKSGGMKGGFSSGYGK